MTTRTAAPDPTAPKRRKPGGKPSRAEKAELTRKALLDAAEAVVGEQGYLEAMVSAITLRARVAAGTFYNYFESQQDLFNTLLPTVGRELLEHIKTSAESAPSAAEREERRMRAFFDFLQHHPGFYRVLYEAEVFAPEAFRAHIETVTSGYARALRRDKLVGELGGFTDEEIEVVACMLLGARHYLCMRYTRRDGQPMPLPESVINAYMKVVTAGFFVRKKPRRKKA